MIQHQLLENMIDEYEKDTSYWFRFILFIKVLNCTRCGVMTNIIQIASLDRSESTLHIFLCAIILIFPMLFPHDFIRMLELACTTHHHYYLEQMPEEISRILHIP